MPSPVFSTSRWPLTIGHRGASALAAENSLAAFRLAASADGPGRCDGVELDIQTTADGGFVVHHDAALATGELIATLPISTVCATRLPDGSNVPALADALAVLKGLTVFVEVKTLPPDADDNLRALLRSHGLERIAVHAFDHRIIARLRRADAELRLGVLSCAYPVDPVRQVADAGATMLWQEAQLIDAMLVSACHAEGIAVIAWTVNEIAEAQRLADLGVDGLCGNWPDRLRPMRP